MTTLFDIGDKISVTLTGKVIGFSIHENSGDCYTIETYDSKGQPLRVYLSGKDLEAATKVKDS